MYLKYTQDNFNIISFKKIEQIERFDVFSLKKKGLRKFIQQMNKIHILKFTNVSLLAR